MGPVKLTDFTLTILCAPKDTEPRKMRAQATEIQFLNKKWGSLKVFKEKNHYELNNTYTFLTGKCKKLRNHVPCSINCMCVVSYEQLKTMRNADNFHILTNASSFCSGSCCHLICCVNITFPNSISHTWQVKPEPDACYLALPK